MGKIDKEVTMKKALLVLACVGLVGCMPQPRKGGDIELRDEHHVDYASPAEPDRPRTNVIFHFEFPADEE